MTSTWQIPKCTHCKFSLHPPPPVLNSLMNCIRGSPVTEYTSWLTHMRTGYMAGSRHILNYELLQQHNTWISPTCPKIIFTISTACQQSLWDMTGATLATATPWRPAVVYILHGVVAPLLTEQQTLNPRRRRHVMSGSLAGAHEHLPLAPDGAPAPPSINMSA